MAFHSVWTALRTLMKPGTHYSRDNEQTLMFFGDNQNVDPNGDIWGNQWIRDAGKPITYTYGKDPSAAPYDEDNPPFLPFQEIWLDYINVSIAPIGDFQPYNGSAKVACALYNLIAWGGDPTVDWDAAPLYLQIHVGSFAVAGGKVPDLVFPVPRPPNQLVFSPGADTPFNLTNGYRSIPNGTGGGAAVFSSTPFTYTASPTLGSITVNWAAYLPQNVP